MNFATGYILGASSAGSASSGQCAVDVGTQITDLAQVIYLLGALLTAGICAALVARYSQEESEAKIVWMGLLALISFFWPIIWVIGPCYFIGGYFKKD